MGAIAFVCVAIQQDCFTIPWYLWREMKIAFGRKYIKSAEADRYKIRYSTGIMFLDKIHLMKVQDVKSENEYLQKGRFQI